MLSDRLSVALETGAVAVPPDGKIAVIGPDGADALEGLPQERVEVITRHFPDHETFTRRGYETRPDLCGPYTLSILALPRAKDAARDLIARAAEVTEGVLVIDGPKTHGVEAILREVRARAEVGEVISKAHGKVFVVKGGDFADWKQEPHRLPDGRITAPGAFSADDVDPGTALLAEALPSKLPGHVVDLGAGWGALAPAILSREGVTSLDLVEADHAALSAARHNVTDPRARFHWADARKFSPASPADHIVTNPPFHTGRAADPSLGRAFIAAAAQMLTRSGDLWLVANRHLPYERALTETFRNVRSEETSAYKIFHASGPRVPPKRI